VGEAADFSAADSFIGYIYQCEYALYRMLDRDNPLERISVETLDDVVEGGAGSPEALLQLKHHSTGAKALTDKSPDVWKTIRVWCDHIKKKKVDPASTGFFLLTTSVASGGSSLALFLAPEGTASRDVVAGLATVTSLAEEISSTPGVDVKSPTFKGASAFLGLSASERMDLIRNMRIVTAQPVITDLRKRIIDRLNLSGITKPHLGDFCTSVVGWWYWAVVETMTIKGSTYIEREQIEAKLGDLVTYFVASALPAFDDLVQPTEGDLSPLYSRLFVAQMALLGMGANNSAVAGAVIDYYRAEGHIKRWMEQLRLSPNELKAFEADLEGIWALHFGEAEAECAACEIGPDPEAALAKLGRQTLVKTTSTAGPTLKGFSGDYVRRGALHRLANVPTIGWHPHWQLKLSSKSQNS
jgi:hypothetical protein